MYFLKKKTSGKILPIFFPWEVQGYLINHLFGGLFGLNWCLTPLGRALSLRGINLRFPNLHPPPFFYSNLRGGVSLFSMALKGKSPKNISFPHLEQFFFYRQINCLKILWCKYFKLNIIRPSYNWFSESRLLHNFLYLTYVSKYCI